jgi:hypothetical protein
MRRPSVVETAITDCYRSKANPEKKIQVQALVFPVTCKHEFGSGFLSKSRSQVHERSLAIFFVVVKIREAPSRAGFPQARLYCGTFTLALFCGRLWIRTGGSDTVSIGLRDILIERSSRISHHLRGIRVKIVHWVQGT